MSYKILIPTDISEVGKKYLREKGYEIKHGRAIDEDSIIEDAKDCDAILARNEYYTQRVLNECKHIKVIGKHGVGLDKIDVPTCKELGIALTNGPISNTVAVAEHTALLVLACAKKLVMFDKAMRGADYEIRDKVKGNDVEGKTLCIIGMGKIGQMTAKKLAFGFEMKVIGYDPYIAAENVPDYITRYDSMQEAIAAADYVSLHLPATKENDKFFDMSYFKLMKSSAYFINSARGRVVNEADLYEALTTGVIAGAGLDVFYDEPVKMDNPLFKLDNVIVTPHNAALTYETTDRMGLHAAMGIDEVLQGKEVTWPVFLPEK